MLRPWWFPEYNPADQKTFDTVKTIIAKVFAQRNYAHIRTPAVEKNEVLLKGGDDVVNEIFGLVWLKDYENGKVEQAKKDYSLHFDLTIPFARYTLDHLNDLVLPFKRYQMQPVWRGESSKRGRYKEFWQCDIDAIRRSWSAVGYRYGVETIYTLQIAMQSVFTSFNIQKSFCSHIAHIGLTKAFLGFHLDNDDTRVKAVTDLLDKFHKKTLTEFTTELSYISPPELTVKLLLLIETRDYSMLRNYDEPAYIQLENTIKSLEKLWAHICYDITIVRGLGYYTDIVFETFLEGELLLGSICSGGGYEEFTKFLDPKQVFSGIGGSIGVSRLMEIILEQPQEKDTSDIYMFMHFDETFDAMLTIYTRFLSEGKVCEIYPTPANFRKQFEYATKKGITHVVIFGTNEQEKGIYIVKDLRSGEQKEVRV